MNNSLEYKGYKGIVEFSANDNVFFGKIFGINDLMTFEGNSVKQLEKNFCDTVDDYLSMCKKIGKEPERPYKGSFNVRVSPEIHRKAAFKAQSLNISLNELVENAIMKEIQEVKLHAGERTFPEVTAPPKKSGSKRRQPRKANKSSHKHLSTSKRK